MKLFQPRGPRVLVKRLDEAQPQSKLLTVIQANPKPGQFGFVLAVGHLKHSPELALGQVVVLKDFCGTIVHVELTEGASPEECALVMEDDVLMICEGF